MGAVHQGVGIWLRDLVLPYECLAVLISSEDLPHVPQ